MNPHRTRPATLLMAIMLAVLIPCAAAADDSAALYKSKCAACHGPDGTGNTPMGKKLAAKSLSSPDVQKKNDGDLQKVIASGRNKMPAYGSRLSAEDIGGLVKFIRGLAK